MKVYSAQYARYVHIVFLASFLASPLILGHKLPRTKDCHGKTGLRVEMSELISR